MAVGVETVAVAVVAMAFPTVAMAIKITVRQVRQVLQALLVLQAQVPKVLVHVSVCGFPKEAALFTFSFIH